MLDFGPFLWALWRSRQEEHRVPGDAAMAPAAALLISDSKDLGRKPQLDGCIKEVRLPWHAGTRAYTSMSMYTCIHMYTHTYVHDRHVYICV